jgi:hypothetical protein
VRPSRALAHAALALTLPLVAAAESPPGVIDAMRLEILTERIAKLHAQAGLNVMAPRARRDLSQAMRDFDRTLTGLHAAAKEQDLRETYSLEMLLWQGYRDWASRTPSRENARKLRPRAEEVAWVAAKGARMWQERSRSREAIRAAALRAMQAAVLAQRIAKARLWMRWDIRDPALERELKDSNENLHRLLATLRETPPASAEAAEALQGAQAQLGFMDDAQRELDRGANAARALEFIAKAADYITESMERAATAEEAR